MKMPGQRGFWLTQILLFALVVSYQGCGMSGVSKKSTTIASSDDLDFFAILSVSLTDGSAIGFGQGEIDSDGQDTGSSRFRAAGTTDAAHWTDLNPEDSGSSFDLTPTDVLMDYANDKIYLVGNNSGSGKSYVSSDHGENWTPLTYAAVTLVPQYAGSGLSGIAQNSSGDLYASGYIAESPYGLGGTIYSGIVYKYAFGDTDWRHVLHKREPYSGYSFNDIAVRESGTAEQVFAVGYGGPDCNGSVTVASGWCTAQSLNGGTSWSFIDFWTSSTSYSKAQKIIVHPTTNDVYVFGVESSDTLKIRKSTDGLTFSEVYSGDSTDLGSDTYSIDVKNAFVLSDGTIYAVGTFYLVNVQSIYDGFALKSTNDGATWSVDNLPQLRNLDVCPNTQIELSSGPILAVQTCENGVDRRNRERAPFQDFWDF